MAAGDQTLRVLPPLVADDAEFDEFFDKLSAGAASFASSKAIRNAEAINDRIGSRGLEPGAYVLRLGIDDRLAGFVRDGAWPLGGR